MKKNYDSLNEKELLTELLNAQKKTLIHSRLATITSFIIFAAMLITLYIIVPQVTVTLKKANTTLKKTDEAIETAEQSFSNIDDMVAKIDILVETNTATVNQIMENINNIRFDKLNQAIEDFSDVVEPLARFANSF